MLSAPKTHIPHGRAGPKVLVLEFMISSMRAFAFVSLATRPSPTSFMTLGPDQACTRRRRTSRGRRTRSGRPHDARRRRPGARRRPPKLIPMRRDRVGVHVRACQEPVDGRRDNGFPIRAEEQLLVTKGAALSRAGKGEDVVATSGGGRAAAEVQLLLGAVEAAVEQECRPGTVWVTAGGMRRSQIGWDPPPRAAWCPRREIARAGARGSSAARRGRSCRPRADPLRGLRGHSTSRRADRTRTAGSSCSPAGRTPGR